MMLRNIISRAKTHMLYNDAPYPMQSFHLDFIKMVKNSTDFRDKTVLEIGGSNYPSHFLFRELGVKKWVCVDYIDFWAEKKTPSAVTSQRLMELGKKTGKFAVCDIEEAGKKLHHHRYMKFYGDADKIPPEFYEQFDMVISNDAMEHIGPLPEVIDKIYNCLRPVRGKFYAYAGPIYSGSAGNHYRLNDKANFSTMQQDNIPDFAHLIWNEEEMREYFATHPLPYGKVQLEALVDWSYHNNGITRRFYCDYEDIMRKSRFSSFFITPHWNIPPHEDTLKILQKKYPQNTIWANGIWIEAQKR